MMANLRRRKSDTQQPLTAESRGQSITHQLRKRAYEIYQLRGGEGAPEWDDWIQATRDLDPPDEDYGAPKGHPKTCDSVIFLTDDAET